MSAKYEQKRYWVDPNTILQLQDLPSSSSSSGSSLGHGHGVLNRSPSLSSSSGCSLNGGNTANGVSPILNNLRNSRGGLVCSQTLPDIKPLTSLLPHPPGSMVVNGVGVNAPINFINNLSSLQNNQDDKIINTNPNKERGDYRDPWGSSNNGGSDLNGKKKKMII
jgi:hypothetical protein